MFVHHIQPTINFNTSHYQFSIKRYPNISGKSSWPATDGSYYAPSLSNLYKFKVVVRYEVSLNLTSSIKSNQLFGSEFIMLLIKVTIITSNFKSLYKGMAIVTHYLSNMGVNLIQSRQLAIHSYSMFTIKQVSAPQERGFS